MEKTLTEKNKLSHVWVKGSRKSCYVINNFSLCQSYEFVNAQEHSMEVPKNACEECLEIIRKIKG